MHRRSPLRLIQLSAVVLATCGLAACGSSGARQVTDSQVDTWVTAVRHYGGGVNYLSTCYLLTRTQLLSDVAQPTQEWFVLGSFAEFGIGNVVCEATTGSAARPTGPLTAEVIEVSAQPNNGLRAGTPYRELPIPHSSWYLTYVAWNNREPTMAEMRLLEDTVIANIRHPPSANAYVPVTATLPGTSGPAPLPTPPQ